MIWQNKSNPAQWIRNRIYTWIYISFLFVNKQVTQLFAIQWIYQAYVPSKGVLASCVRSINSEYIHKFRAIYRIKRVHLVCALWSIAYRTWTLHTNSPHWLTQLTYLIHRHFFVGTAQFHKYFAFHFEIELEMECTKCVSGCNWGKTVRMKWLFAQMARSCHSKAFAINE